MLNWKTSRSKNFISASDIGCRLHNIFVSRLHNVMVEIRMIMIFLTSIFIPFLATVPSWALSWVDTCSAITTCSRSRYLYQVPWPRLWVSLADGGGEAKRGMSGGVATGGGARAPTNSRCPPPPQVPPQKLMHIYFLCFNLLYGACVNTFRPHKTHAYAFLFFRICLSNCFMPFYPPPPRQKWWPCSDEKLGLFFRWGPFFFFFFFWGGGGL